MWFVFCCFLGNLCAGFLSEFCVWQREFFMNRCVWSWGEVERSKLSNTSLFLPLFLATAFRMNRRWKPHEIEENVTYAKLRFGTEGSFNRLGRSWKNNEAAIKTVKTEVKRPLGPTVLAPRSRWLIQKTFFFWNFHTCVKHNFGDFFSKFYFMKWDAKKSVPKREAKLLAVGAKKKIAQFLLKVVFSHF